MLTSKQRTQIFKEVVLKTVPSLMTPEAEEYRRELAEEVAQMEKDGIVPEMPFDLFDDDDPLPLTPSDPLPLNPHARSIYEIQQSLTVDERLWLGQMIEAYGEEQVIKLWPSYCVQLEFGRSL